MHVKCAIFILAILPNPGDPVDERHDAIEINHVYDCNGKKILTQLIIWNDGDIVAWRKLDKHPYIERLGAIQRRILVYDGDIFRSICAHSAFETHTQYDVELHQRKIGKGTKYRRGLLFEKHNAP